MYGGKTVYIGLSIIHGFRHRLEGLRRYPLVDKGRLLYSDDKEIVEFVTEFVTEIDIQLES